MFDDNSDNPFMIILESEQVFFHPSKKDFGWNGCFYIYSGSLTDYKVYFRNVYYRITETLPFLQPPEDPFDYGEPLFKIEKQEHFEAHGNRWSALDLSDEMADLITTCLQEGALLERYVYKDPKKKKDILPLVYPANETVKICTINVTKGKGLVLESMFPLLEGIQNEVVLGEKYTWKNGFEGEVEIDINGFDSFFFAPFYKQEFTNIIKGSRAKVFLAGLASSIQDAMMEFDVDKGPMYENGLKEFLLENPSKTKEDFHNPIVHMAGLVMMFPTETYSEYQYRGTILSLEYVEFLGKKIAKTRVCIKRNEDGEELMHINLYIPLSCCNNCTLEVGKDIQAIIWLQGYNLEAY
jgi:hypothetical protein